MLRVLMSSAISPACRWWLEQAMYLFRRHPIYRFFSSGSVRICHSGALGEASPCHKESPAFDLLHEYNAARLLPAENGPIGKQVAVEQSPKHAGPP